MTLYILSHFWYNDTDDGSEILGLYRNQNKARAEMNRLADEFIQDCQDENWNLDPDYTWGNEDERHAGSEGDTDAWIVTPSEIID